MKSDRRTIASLAVIASALATLLHEGLGHGVTAWLRGDQVTELTSNHLGGSREAWRHFSAAARTTIAPPGFPTWLPASSAASRALSIRSDFNSGSSPRSRRRLAAPPDFFGLTVFFPKNYRAIRCW